MAARALLLSLLCAFLLAPTCDGGGGGGGIRSWEVYASLTGSSAVLPTVLTVGPGLSAEDAIEQANGIGCGVEVRLSGVVAADELVAVARCPDPDQLGIRIRGPATVLGGVRSFCDGPDCAWVSAEDLTVIASAGVVNHVGDRKIVVLTLQPRVEPKCFRPYQLLLVGRHGARHIHQIDDGGVGLGVRHLVPSAISPVFANRHDHRIARVVCAFGDLSLQRLKIGSLEVPQ